MVIKPEKEIQINYHTGRFFPGVLCLALVSLQACTPAALKEDLRLAASLNDEARLYHQQGEYAEAERLYLRSLAIREKALGPDHVDVATSLNNLVELYQAQDKNLDAEPLLLQLEAIRRRAIKRLGGKPPGPVMDERRFPKFPPRK